MTVWEYIAIVSLVIGSLGLIVSLLSFLATVLGWRLPRKNVKEDPETQPLPPITNVGKKNNKLWFRPFLREWIAFLMVNLTLAIVLTSIVVLEEQSSTSDVGKEPETQSHPRQTDVDKAEKLELSKLIGILEDLSTQYARKDFIKNNRNLMADSLSLDGLHRILDLFHTDDGRLAVIRLLFSRLPGSLSLGELNHILDRFSAFSDKFILDWFSPAYYKFQVTEIFLSRLEDNYSDNDFKIYKQHYPTNSTKQEAIELLRRKNQKQ